MAEQSISATEVASVDDAGEYETPDDRSSSVGGANACSSADRSKEHPTRAYARPGKIGLSSEEQELAKKNHRLEKEVRRRTLTQAEHEV